MIFKQDTLKNIFSGININEKVEKPFSNAKTVIDLYNDSLKNNTLTQEHWKDILDLCDDSLSNYLQNIKGQEATLTGYNVSLQGNITGFKKVYAAIGEYNKLSASNSDKQKEYCDAISLTNSKLGTYLANLNGSKAGMVEYAISLVGATIKTIGLQVATMALNAAISMGASIIISSIVTAISNWIKQDEILAEKAETAKQKIDELNNEYKEHSQLISDSAKRYAELAQGVNQLTGENLSLNNDDYKEFLDLSNQLAEAFPTLSRNYKENGDAILQLSGNVDTIVGSLNNLIEAEKELRNQQIAEELPTIYKNADKKSNDYKKQLKSLKEQRQTLIDGLGDVQSDNFFNNFIDGINESFISVEGENLETLSKVRDDYLKILKDANIQYEELTPDYKYKDGVEVPVRFNIKINSSEEDIAKAKNIIKSSVEKLAVEYERDISDLNTQIQSIQDKNKSNWISLSSSIAAWLNTEDSYKIMSNDIQATIQNVINNLDWGELNFSSWEDAKQYIQDNILSLYQTANGKETLKQIEVMFGIQTQFNNGKIPVKEYQDRLKIFLDEISTLDPNTQKAIRLIFGISANEDGTTTSSVDTMVANVKNKLQDEFDDKVGELSLDDLQVASNLEIPEGTLLSWDELKQKIEEVNSLESDINPTLSDIFSLKDSENNLTELGKINEEIDKFQSAYTTLKETMDSYNETGTFTLDQVQGIVALGDEYLKYLMDENGNLQLNEEALNNVALARKNEMRVKALSNLMDNLESITNEKDALSYLETQLLDTAQSYDDFTKSRIRAWTEKALESGEISEGTINRVRKAFENQAYAINEMFDKIDPSSVYTKSSSASKSAAKDATDNIKDQIEAYMSYQKASLESGKIDYNTYCNTVKNYLTNMYHTGKIAAEDYHTYIGKMLDNQLKVYDSALKAILSRIQKEIDVWQKKIDELKDANEKLTDEQEVYNKALSYAQDLIQKQIDGYDDLIDKIDESSDKLNQQKDDLDGILSAIYKVYDDRIDDLNKQSDAIQEQIDLLNDENSALDLQYRKQQALAALDKAKQQRTKKIYIEGEGYVYKQDEEAIREAEKNLQDIQNEELIASLNKEKDALADSVKELEKYKDLWSEISDFYENEANKNLLIGLFGDDYKDKVLQNNVSDIEDFKKNYLDIQQKLNDNEELKKSYEEKKKYYDDLKNKWGDLSNAASEEEKRQAAIKVWGAEYEKIILEGRDSDLAEFQDIYL